MIQAVLLFLSTTPYASHLLFLILIPYIYFKNGYKLKLDVRHYFFISLSILSILNFVIGLGFGNIKFDNLTQLVPYLALSFLTVNVADHVNKKVCLFFFYLIMIEIIAGILQYLLGIRDFSGTKIILDQTESLYQRHVYGFSGNSSGFALKVFISLNIFLKYIDDFKRTKILGGLIILGLIISFNRTFIICSLILFALWLRKNNILHHKSLYRLFFIPVIAISIYSSWNQISQQFLRGNSDISNTTYILSERDIIYVHYIDHILSNPIQGNYSQKLLFTTPDGRILHAHNSYLQTAANHGLIIFGLFIVFIFILIQKKEKLFVIPFLVSGILQYSIFWGASVTDVFFYNLIESKDE